jgi:hypothetical protein
MSLLGRIANLFSRSRVDREIEAEFRSHIDLRVEDNLAAGMSREEARRDALVRFGNRTATKEQVGSADMALTLESVAFDPSLCVSPIAPLARFHADGRIHTGAGDRRERCGF